MRSAPPHVLPGLALPPELQGVGLAGDYVNDRGVRMRVRDTGRLMPVSTARGDDPPRVETAFHVQMYRKGWHAWESAPQVVTRDAIVAYVMGYRFARVR